MSSKQPKSTSTTTQQVYSPEETAARNSLFNASEQAFKKQQNLVQNAGNPAAQPVPFSPETLQAQDMLKQYATGSGQNAADAIAGGVNYGLNGAMDVGNNPYFQKTLDAAIQGVTRNYTDPNGVLAQIRSGATADGQYGGSRQGIAEGVAAGRYANEIGNIAATMGSDAYNKGQDTFARTLAFAPTALQAGTVPASIMSSIGSQNENLAQLLENYNAAGREFSMNSPFIPVQNYANIVNGLVSPTITSTNSASQGRSPLSFLGGAAAGAMAGAPMGPIGMAVGGGLGLLSNLF